MKHRYGKSMILQACSRGLAGFSILFLAIGGWANSETASDRVEEPSRQTEIVADSGSMDFRTGIANFEGNVTVTDEDVVITADHLQVVLDEDNQIKSLEARGQVVIRQAAQQRLARSGYALYSVATRTVVLMDSPRVEVGDSVLDEAYRITYNMESEEIKTEAGPGQRTRLTIPASGSRRPSLQEEVEEVEEVSSDD